MERKLNPQPTLPPTLTSSPDADRVAANLAVLKIFSEAQPTILDIQTALHVIPRLTPSTILHAGPPIEWPRMCGPMQGAILGAIVYEGLAPDLDAAAALIERGGVTLASCHDHDAVAPMAGVISPSMPVWVIEDRAHGTRAYSNLNEGMGRTLRYGANGSDVVARLKWMQDFLAPRLREAVLRGAHAGGIAVFPIIKTALQMGDECHSRNKAAMALLLQTLLPHFLATQLPHGEIAEVFAFLTVIDYFFLNVTMASCKASWLLAERVPGASVVTALSRNGIEFGMRLQGQWFAAPSPVVDGHYFPGFTADDANRDIGDSAITEASGLGGFAAGGAPSVTGFVGSTAEELREANAQMYQIATIESPHFGLTYLNGRGTPTGIDVLKVVETGITPYVTTGIAHKRAGVGQVGAGRVRAPLALFEQAAAWLNSGER